MPENEGSEERDMRAWEYLDLDAFIAVAVGTAVLVIGLKVLGHQVIGYWQQGERLLAGAISATVIALPVIGFMRSKSWRDFLRRTLILIFCLGSIVYFLASYGFKLPAGWLH